MKLVDSEADEVYVLQRNQETTVTKTVSFTIPDFLQKIFDKNNEMKPITSPRFKLGVFDLEFEVRPEDDEGYVGFYIQNPNKKEVMISMEVNKPEKAIEIAFYRIIWKANGSRGWQNYMRHDDYRNWADENGDEFKIEATVTLHLTEGSFEQWTTLRLDVKLLIFIILYFVAKQID